MSNRYLLTIACLVAFNLRAAPALAQTEKQTENWTIDVSGASAPTVGVTRDHLKRGWNVDVGAERTIVGDVGLRADFGYYHLGVADQVLQALAVPSGTAHMYSLTAGPTWRFPIGGSVRGYALGGVGWYRRTVDFLQPTVGVIDIVDPWWGYVGSVVVPANQILGSVTSNAFGANAGGGVSIALGSSGAEFFGEVRYHHANTKTTSTTVTPVSFGIRWGGHNLTNP